MVSVQMGGSHFLWTGQLNVYFCIIRKVFEVDCVNGLNFLFKIHVTVLGEFVTTMEIGNFFSAIC